MTPPLRPENDEGYFEIIEGPDYDLNHVPVTPPPPPVPPTMLGDADDVLMFTVRSRGEPFVGRFNGTTVESQIAEVMYFCATEPSQSSTRSSVRRLASSRSIAACCWCRRA